jgi:hypothetical protein
MANRPASSGSRSSRSKPAMIMPTPPTADVLRPYAEAALVGLLSGGALRHAVLEAARLADDQGVRVDVEQAGIDAIARTAWKIAAAMHATRP